MIIDNVEVIKEIPISEISNYKINKKIRFFLNKGLNCSICGAKGKFFAQCKNDKYIFIRLIAQNKKGKYVFMTADHIYPKSKGGTNKLRNLQPMCSSCNQIKGDKTTVNKYVGFLMWTGKKPDVKVFISENKYMFQNYKGKRLGEIFACNKKQARKLFKKTCKEKINVYFR